MKLDVDPAFRKLSFSSDLDSARKLGVQEFLAALQEEEPKLFRAVVAGASALMDRLATAVQSSDEELVALDLALTEFGFDELTGAHLVEAALYVPSAQYKMNRRGKRRRRR